MWNQQTTTDSKARYGGEEARANGPDHRKWHGLPQVGKLLREVRISRMDGIKYLGVVALLVDKPEAGLKRGDVGTVVEVFESNEHHPGGCIVEFVD